MSAYFSDNSFGFLRALARHNQRAWFLAHKGEYETAVREPFQRLVGDLQPALAAISGHYRAEPKAVGGSLFRIQRDTRFSGDKTPYKTWQGARLFHARSRQAEAPSFYLHLQPGNCFVGGGIWHPSTPALRRIRQFIVDNPGGWQAAAHAPAFRRRYDMESGEMLVRKPPGFPADFPVQELDSPNGSVKSAGDKRIMPRVMEWNLSLQHEFLSQWLAQVAYVGTRAYHLWNHEASDLNQPLTPLDTNFSDDTGNLGRPYFDAQPNLASIYPMDYPQLELSYHSLQTSLNRRFQNGFNVLFAYTFSKDLGNADGNVGGVIQDSHHVEREHGPVSPDLRHRFTASYLYELPFGRGRKFQPNLNSAANLILGGWDIAGVTAAQSGQAFTAVSSGDLSNTGSFSYRFNQVAKPSDFSYDPDTQ